MRILIVPHATRHRLCSFFLCLHLRYKSWESSEFQRDICRDDDRMWSGEARAVDIFPVRLTGSGALAVPNVMATLQTRCLLSIFLVNLPKCVILRGKPIKTCALLSRELLSCCIPVVIQDSFCVLLNYVWKTKRYICYLCSLSTYKLVLLCSVDLLIADAKANSCFWHSLRWQHIFLLHVHVHCTLY